MDQNDTQGTRYNGPTCGMGCASCRLRFIRQHQSAETAYRDAKSLGNQGLRQYAQGKHRARSSLSWLTPAGKVCKPFLCLSALSAARLNEGTCGLPKPTALQTTAVLRELMPVSPASPAVAAMRAVDASASSAVKDMRRGLSSGFWREDCELVEVFQPAGGSNFDRPRKAAWRSMFLGLAWRIWDDSGIPWTLHYQWLALSLRSVMTHLNAYALVGHTAGDQLQEHVRISSACVSVMRKHRVSGLVSHLMSHFGLNHMATSRYFQLYSAEHFIGFHH